MAKNDVVLLDGIIDQRLAENLPSSERDEVFEFLAIEEVLKDYDLSNEEIDFGWIDGRNDGGIDGFYVLINGHLLEDSNDFLWPRNDASIDIWLITCKHHSTFRQATLDALIATIHEVFDLSLSDEELKGSYSEDLLVLRNLFASAYRKLSIGRPILRFHVIYASRGDSNEVGESIVSRSIQIESLITSLFSSCNVDFKFIGASELVESHRRIKSFSLNLPFLEHLTTGQDSYVLLVRLEDYWKFVSDEMGNLRRYLFDSNVRDYLGKTGVNDDIAQSLLDASAPDFWWLNNGVTILATNATVPGKTIQLQNIQIVNGLQTTETIHKHFQGTPHLSQNRSLLVKVIVSLDDQVRDRIIRATNNQTPVEISALHATDKIQRDIEAILERHNWFYERRRNYYRNIGKPQARFVTPLYLASAVVALIFKNPSAATRLKQKSTRSQANHDSVFSATLPITIWPVLVEIFKSVDVALAQLPPSAKRGERFSRNWRPLVAFLVVAKRLGRFDYTNTQLLTFIDSGPILQSEIDEAWDVIGKTQKGYENIAKIRLTFAYECCNEASKTYGLTGLQTVGRRHIGFASQSLPTDASFSPELLLKVENLLPKQPWKSGIHIEIANTLSCSPKEISEAIRILIASKKRHIQIDGVVYNPDGSVIATDPENASGDSTCL